GRRSVLAVLIQLVTAPELRGRATRLGHREATAQEDHDEPKSQDYPAPNFRCRACRSASAGTPHSALSASVVAGLTGQSSSIPFTLLYWVPKRWGCSRYMSTRSSLAATSH